MDWKQTISLIGCLLVSGAVSSQHFIGEDKIRVKELMEDHNREVFLDGSSVNTVYNTLKYVDRTGNQTMLFVFTDDDVCQYIKWMCDYSMMNRVVAGLNSRYEQSAGDSWHYEFRGEPYIITLTTGDWFFTVTTRKEESKDH